MTRFLSYTDHGTKFVFGDNYEDHMIVFKVSIADFHITKHAIQYTVIFSSVKNESAKWKNNIFIYFFFLLKTWTVGTH